MGHVKIEGRHRSAMENRRNAPNDDKGRLMVRKRAKKSQEIR